MCRARKVTIYGAFYFGGFMKKIKRNRQEDIERRHRKAFVAFFVCLSLSLCIILSYKIYTVKAKNEKASQTIVELNKKLDNEKARSAELDQLEKDVKSDEYAQKVAREKFNLCYPDEIVFTPDK